MNNSQLSSVARLVTRYAILFSIIAVLGLTNFSRAQQPSIQQIGPGIWAAGIPTNEFEFVAARQRHSNWCWAASVQMVLNYRGVPVTQEQVVQRIFGGAVPDLPGQPEQILTALSGWAFTRNGQPVMLSSSPFAFSGSEIVRDLAERWPIVVGVKNSPTSGHAYVLTAVTYQVDAWNQPIFLTAVLRDPWPDNPSRIEVPWVQFQQNWMFMARMRIMPR